MLGSLANSNTITDNYALQLCTVYCKLLSVCVCVCVCVSCHFSSVFKKTVRQGKCSLDICKAHILEYSSTHVPEVWVRYTTDSSEDWRKFSISKSAAVPSLPAPTSSRKYGSSLQIKATKVADLQTPTAKDISDEHKIFLLPGIGVF